MKRHLDMVGIVACWLVAAFLRFPRLADRPMHTDEAVQAFKFGALLGGAPFRYDPGDYHGPTLHYATRILTFLSGQTRLEQLTESSLRCIPASFGVACAILLIGLRGGMAPYAIRFATLLFALSPAMVFYGRYYIHEMLLVFGIVCLFWTGYRWTVTGKRRWAVGCGLSLGFMAATKETWIMVLWASLLALWFTDGLSPKRNPTRRPPLVDSGWIAGIALATSALFYTSFGTHLRGIRDPLDALFMYVDKAWFPTRHAHPWYAYLRWYGAFRHPQGPLWGEAPIFLFGLRGVWIGLRDRNRSPFLRFIAWYTLLITGLFSLLPYKTPWSFLPAWFGWILLAGAGIASFWEKVNKKTWRWISRLGVAFVLVFLTVESWLLNFRLMDNPVNPYVYAHPRSDVIEIGRRVREVALAQPDGLATPMEVIVPHDEYWPLPWYLRDFPRVGWYASVPDTPRATLFLVSPDVEEPLAERLYETRPPGERPLYVPLFDKVMELRPGFEIRGYTEKSVWDRYVSRIAPSE